MSKIEGYPPGSIFEIDDVLLVGTRDFTLIGRPKVKNAKVYLRVEEQTKTSPMVVFKKKRRKGY